MIMEPLDYQTEEMSHQSSNGVKLEISDSPLNFATSVEDYEMHGPPSKKPKTPRDPMSHRIIEKRRRDRMNNCLADLSRLIPANYMKQGQGRIEKTEIIEMAIRHIKHLQNVHRSIVSQGQCCAEKFYLGFKECEAEAVRYFVECEGLDSKDQFCMRVISHLEAASQKFVTGNQPCGDYRKEETNSDDKGSIGSTIASECENSKPQNLKAEIVSQSVPTMLSPSHDSINSSTSKQLRSLLSHSSSGFDQVDSGNGSCTDSLSTYSNSESYISSIPHEDGGAHLTGANSETHYRSHSSLEGSSSNSSKDSKFTNYKFKHDITKRFSQEEKFSVDLSMPAHHELIHEQDGNVYEKHIRNHDKHSSEKHGHSYEKHEKMSGKLKRKMARSKSPSSSSSSDSTVYPTSEHSSNGNGGNISSIQCGTAENDVVTTGVPLPAFVLHPQGTHYLPLTIQPSCFENALPQLDRVQQPLVFHPISILVNFSAPGLVIQNAEAFVSSVNPSTAFPNNMCSNPSMNPMTNSVSSSSSSSSSESSSGNHNLINISSGSFSSSSSGSSSANNSSMNCSSGSSSSSNSSCSSLSPHSEKVTPTNNISGAITTMASINTPPVMNNIMPLNTMQPIAHIPPVLLGGGVTSSEHHLVVNTGLQGSSVITNTNANSPPTNTNNNNNSTINLSTNATSQHHPLHPQPHHHHAHHHSTNKNNTNKNNNNNNNSNNTNISTTSSHLKLDERGDNTNNSVSSSHCYSNL